MDIAPDFQLGKFDKQPRAMRSRGTQYKEHHDDWHSTH
jgi:hypothetical protein